MNIKSKKESVRLIKELGLNGVPEEIIEAYDDERIRAFCRKYQASTYILRDLYKPNGQYYLCYNVEECIANAKNYEKDFLLGVSVVSYDGKILLGDILVNKEKIILTARTDIHSHHRNIYSEPEIMINTTWFDKKLFNIKGVDVLLAYIVNHNLYDTIIEFVVYDNKVGMKNENVLIVEFRDTY